MFGVQFLVQCLFIQAGSHVLFKEGHHFLSELWYFRRISFSELKFQGSVFLYLNSVTTSEVHLSRGLIKKIGTR
jgi:hypothetical protein